MFLLGVPPGAEEIGARVHFPVVTIAYAGVWLALAMLFSIVFRSRRDRGAGRRSASGCS